tara:strand:+ start:1615 stop:2049 length:435 start_codon:yes stop_codon:yes gene_type:complete
MSENKNLETGQVMTIEASKEEVMKWLEFKKVRQSTINNSEEAIDNLAGAIAEGLLVLNDGFEWEQKLLSPIKTEDSTTETLVYKPRLAAWEIQESMKGVKTSDVFGIMFGIVAKLTGKFPQMIKKLDTEDYGICQNIALFFVPK